MKNHKKTALIFLILPCVMPIRAYSVTINDIYNYSLSSGLNELSVSKDLKKFMSQNGFRESEINNFIQLSNKYKNSLEELWEKIETGSIIFDDALFNDPDVKRTFQKALNEFSNEEDAHQYIKKTFINNTDLAINKIKNQLKNTSFITGLFDEKFNRKPSETEMKWLSDLSTIKYALYGGFIGEELSYDQIEMIKNNKGYSLIGVSEEAIKQYIEYSTLKSRFKELEALYNKTIVDFYNIQKFILKELQIDIFNVFSNSELLSIHNKSIDGFIFNENKAIKEIVNSLKKENSKIDISSVLENFSNTPTEQEITNINPYNEMISDKSNNDINKFLMQQFDSLYVTSLIKFVQDGLSDKYIYVKYKNKTVNTFIRKSNSGILTSNGMEKLFSCLEENFDLKFICGKNETMFLLDNSIKIVEGEFGSKNEVLFSEIQKVFNELGIEIYEEDIEDLIVEEKPTEFKVNSSLIIDIKDKRIAVDLVSKDAIQKIDLLEVLNLLDVKIIFSLDSSILLKDNIIYNSKNVNLGSQNITVAQIVAVLNDINIEVLNARVEH